MDEMDKVAQEKEILDAIESANMLVPHLPTIAGWYWATYDQLIQAGFSSDQAMDLIKTHGWNLEAK